MSKLTWFHRWLAVLGIVEGPFLILVLALVGLAGCTPAATTAPTATPAPSLPEVTVEVSDTAFIVPANLPSGIVAVTLKNTGQNAHAPILARLNAGETEDTFMTALAADVFQALELISLLGGQEIAPGMSQRVIYDFKPGDHLALEFPDDSAPWSAAFQVAAASGTAVPEPAAAVSVDMQDFAFAMPDQITSGAHTWKISNSGAQWHELAIARLHEGVTMEAVMALIMAETPPEGPPPYDEAGMWMPTSAGERAWVTFDLTPGTYAVLCFIPDSGSGKSHTELGMAKLLTVTE